MRSKLFFECIAFSGGGEVRTIWFSFKSPAVDKKILLSEVSKRDSRRWTQEKTEHIMHQGELFAKKEGAGEEIATELAEQKKEALWGFDSRPASERNRPEDVTRLPAEYKR